MSRSVYPRIYGGRRLMRGGSASVTPLSLLEFDAVATNTSALSHTHSGLAAASGTLVVGLTGRNGSSAGVLSDVTANAAAMTILGQDDWHSADDMFAFAALEGFSGASVEIIDTWTVARDKIVVGVWSLPSTALVANMTVVPIAFDNATIPDLDLPNIGESAGGANLYIGGSHGASAPHTWSGGPTPNATTPVSQRQISHAYELPTADATGQTINLALGTDGYIGIYGLQVAPS